MSADLLAQPQLAAKGPGACPVLSTARLVLRPHRAGDADAITVSLGDWQVTRMLARVPVPYGRSDAVDWLRALRNTPSQDWTFAVTQPGDDTHIGCVGLELRHGRWHLGYWLNRAFWGRGLMSEAVVAAVGRFLACMPDTVLHSGAFADNAASLRIQEKLGFRVLRCDDIYCVARNAMVAHLETQVTAVEFNPP